MDGMKEYCPTCGHITDDKRDAEPRIMRWLVTKLAAAQGGLTSRQLAQAISSRDRGYLEVAKRAAVQQGIVTIDTASNRYVLAQP